MAEADGLDVVVRFRINRADMAVRIRAAGRSVAEVGVPYYARTAGSATGAKPQVILRAVRDFWRRRLQKWVNARRAFGRGTPDPGRRGVTPRRLTASTGRR
jgi:hypothetical protein